MCGNRGSNTLNWSPQVVSLPTMWMITYTGDCGPLESRPWAFFTLLFSSRKFPPCACVRWQSLVPLAFVFSSMGSGSFILCLVGLWCWQWSGCSHLWFSSPTCVWFSSTKPTYRLPAWLDSSDSLWLQFSHWNYQCDHRCNPISCLGLEFSKVDMRADVFQIPRVVQFFFFFGLFMDSYKIICTH